MDSEKPVRPHDAGIGIVALTRHGVNLALQLQARLPESICYVPVRHRFALAMGATGFERVGDIFPAIWSRYEALICIMSTGIVVRQIAPLLRHKTVDPGVVVLDERGEFVISLVSGHLGGANELAKRVAEIIGGQAVVTTASDVRNKPALDLIIRKAGLEVANDEMLKRVSRAILEDEGLWIYDPEGRLSLLMEDQPNLTWIASSRRNQPEHLPQATSDSARQSFSSKEARLGEWTADAEAAGYLAALGIWVSEYLAPEDCRCLGLHPRVLVVGIGCNRGTPAEEILDFLHSLFQRETLSLLSIRNLSSIDAKSSEAGILETAQKLKRPVHFFSAKDIEKIDVPNPSGAVARHMGVNSVCEATALLSAQSQTLIIEKQKTSNVTLAVARVNFIS